MPIKRENTACLIQTSGWNWSKFTRYFSVTNIVEDKSMTAASQDIADSTVTEILNYIVVFCRSLLSDIWVTVSNFSLQSQVLLTLTCCLLFNIVAINIAWKLYSTSIRNQDIPSKSFDRCIAHAV